MLDPSSPKAASLEARHIWRCNQVMGYPGGKSSAGVYQRIVNLFPPHDVYIEPFLGGGAVMRRKRAARLNIGIDLDPEVIRVWVASIARNGDDRASPEMAIRTCGLAGNGDVAGALAGNGDADVSIARSGDGRRRSSPKLAMVDDLVASQEMARGYRFAVGDAMRFLSAWRFRGAELVYLDPPYLGSVRLSRRRIYRYEMRDKGDHEALLRLVCSLPCAVVISGYWSELYADLLKGWRSEHFAAMTRGGVATEWLWYNFKPGVRLHEYTYLGSTFRERERIKRRQKRWIARLESMAGNEREALLSAVEEWRSLASLERARSDRASPEMAR